MNYVKYLNSVSMSRQPSPIRVLTAILAQSPPSLISMAGGLPNADLFPIKEANLKLSDGSELQIGGPLMKRALQYSETPGIAELRQWVRELQREVHRPPTLGHSNEQQALDVVITTGSQDGLSKLFEATLTQGRKILMESPTYSGSLGAVRPLGADIIGVETDKDGMRPEKLREALSPWQPSDAADPHSTIPRILYTVPTAGNPTGFSLTLQRKKEIYAIAREYDLLVIEDDPYYYLQFNKPYVPSFLSMDEDGRVVRADSFSKLLSSGIRVGVLTGPRAILDRIQLHMQVSLLHTSSLAQIVLWKVLENMGLEGFLQHAEKVAAFYSQQCQACMEAADTHLTGLAEWAVPTGGMFLWLRLLGIEDTSTLITEKARAKEVLFVPGCNFQIDESAPCSYVRASYSIVTPEKMDLAFSRLAALIKEERQA